MNFCVALPHGVKLSPKQYLSALRAATDNPDKLFRQSFRDPKGWEGNHTGRQIVAEHRLMLDEKRRDHWVALRTWGKGSRSRKRAEALRTCDWCGGSKPSLRVGKYRFCDTSCKRAQLN